MNIISIILYIVLPIICTVYFFLKKKYSYFEDRGIPCVKPQWIIGNIQGAGRTTHMSNVLKSYYEEMKGKSVIAGFYNLVIPVYIVTDLDTAKNIFIKDFNSFVNRGIYFNEKIEPIGANLLAVVDDHWRFLRNKFTPAFTSGKMKLMFEVFQSIGDRLVDAIERETKSFGALEMKDLMQRFTLDIFSSIAFGMEANTLNGEYPELLRYSREAFGEEGASVVMFYFSFSYPNIARFFNVRQFSKGLSDFFHQIITENIKYRENSNEKRNDFLNMLVQLKNKGSIDGEYSTETKKLTNDQCVAQAFIFIIGGSDPTSSALAFAMFEIANSPEIQDKLRSEIIEKTKDTNGEITYDTLQEMTYLNQVMNETLRMYPACYIQQRTASKDYKVPNTNYIIPKDSLVWVPTIGFHFDENHWKDPNTFDPEHFSKEAVAGRHPMAFIPFGDGPRNCIGMRFTQLILKFALATIFKNFKISIDKKTSLPLKFNPKSFQSENIGGIWINFKHL